MGIWAALNVSASGLTAERLRLDLISSNLANADSVDANTGAPFARQLALLVPAGGGSGPQGVRVAAIIRQPALTTGTRQANAAAGAGPVAGTEEPGAAVLGVVDPAREMVDLLAASRAYQLNATAFQTGREMLQRELDIGRS